MLDLDASQLSEKRAVEGNTEADRNVTRTPPPTCVSPLFSPPPSQEEGGEESRTRPAALPPSLPSRAARSAGKFGGEKKFGRLPELRSRFAGSSSLSGL